MKINPSEQLLDFVSEDRERITFWEESYIRQNDSQNEENCRLFVTGLIERVEGFYFSKGLLDYNAFVHGPYEALANCFYYSLME